MPKLSEPFWFTGPSLELCMCLILVSQGMPFTTEWHALQSKTCVYFSIPFTPVIIQFHGCLKGAGALVLSDRSLWVDRGSCIRPGRLENMCTGVLCKHESPSVFVL